MYRWKRWTHSDIGGKAWSIVGSNDQTTWYLVDRISNQDTNNNNVEVIVNSSYSQYSYRYYRWIDEAMTTATQYILSHFFGWWDENDIFLTSDQSFTTSSGAGDVTVGGESSTVFDTTFNAYNWQQTDNYNTTGAYTGSTVMIVYDPTMPISSGTPDAPTNVSWVDLHNGTISVSFTPGADNGSPILNYQYSVEDGANVTVLDPVDSSSPITISGLTNRTGYSLILQAINANGAGAESTPLALYYMCFLEGTKILCYDPESKQEIERPIESLRSGDLVKTTMDGYKAIDTIGTSKIYNPANSMRSKNRLYKYSKEIHPELNEDLVITGCHAVLVSELSDEERADLIDIQGKVYVTADYYRLIACVDKRAQPYEKEGLFNIWHIALENDNYYFNYGIYANGLKVETASKRMMKEMSGMDLIQ
jgi:hypothetical protein